MTNTEMRYAQIEKEALVITWACEKFNQYILGKRILLETDHKPLVPLMTHKHLDNLPPCVLRFRLRLMRFDYEISHLPGKYFYTADALSQAPVNQIPGEEVLKRSNILFSLLQVTYQLAKSVLRCTIRHNQQTPHVVQL